MAAEPSRNRDDSEGFHRSVKPISGGPWGGKGGDMWDDGVYSGIHQIIVVYGDAMGSIHIEYDNNGSSFWLEHGGGTGTKIRKIQLDYPKEILTSISGHYDTYLRSLTFKSNLKKYGPYGRERGTYFSFPNSDGKKIVGFHGRSGSYLDCIGVYLSNFHTAVPPKSVKPILVGPWGGKGGDMWDDGVYSGIHQIIVVYGDAINSIHIEYDNNGSPFWLEHGGSTGSKIGKMQLDYPKEILTSISGHYDTYLTSLTFKSNLKKYGPYGSKKGTYFSFPIRDGKIVGFRGRSGSYLDCIGVYLANLHTVVPPKSLKPISVGPWGGQGGDMWDDGVYSGIHQIIVVYGDAIVTIKIKYDNNGSPFRLEHGGRGGIKIGKIQLDYPKEILTTISGHYDTYLRSLTFRSNLKKYGPYGSEKGTYFSFPNRDGKIVGFHGRSGLYLNCIGVYLSNFHTAVPTKSLKPISVGPWGGQGGDMWDDGAYSGIHRIIVVYGDAIDSIRIKYDNNGSPLQLEHGGSGGNKIGKVHLDYPKEILTTISGHYDTYLRSLTFKSNLKKYGPYGSEKGTYFKLPNRDGKIVGFHGRSGLYLDCIGVYLSNFHTAVSPKVSQSEE